MRKKIVPFVGCLLILTIIIEYTYIYWSRMNDETSTPNTIADLYADGTPSNGPTESTKGDKHDGSLPTLRADGKDSFSRQEIIEIYSYSEETPDGIRMINADNSFVSGRLIFTIKNISVIDHIDALPNRLVGFSYESMLVLDENNRWQESDCPAFILEDGSFEQGWHLIFVDIEVYSDDAAMVTDEDHYDDPYLFRADDLLLVADCSSPANGNYPYSTIDYFSDCGRYEEHEFVYRLLPGETINISVGFAVSSKAHGTTSDISQLKLCNTSQSEYGTFIDITIGE